MTNRYFDDPVEQTEHPRLHAWRSYQRVDGVVGTEVEIKRDRLAFGFSPPRLFVYFASADGAVQRHDEALWEMELDVWLVAQGARARSVRTEVLRTMLRLRHRLDAILRQHGDGFFNGLIVHVVRQGPLGESREVRAFVAQLGDYLPASGPKLARAVEDVEVAFRQTAQEIAGPLRYPRKQAESIFADAVVMFLEERFHVRERSVGARTVVRTR